MEGDLHGFAFFLTLLAGFAWPGLYLLSRRLRQPDDLDVAEADGRPPVLVVHTFERSGTPIWARLAPTPAFFRDLADELLVRALRRSLTPAGPVVFVERPAAPPSHGPMALMQEGHGSHVEALVTRARAAQLVVVVLDGSETMRHELGRVAEAIDLRRLVLAVAPRATQDFFEQWARFRSQLPGLPPLEPRTAAVRFAADGTPTLIGAVASTASARRGALAQPSMLLRESEVSPVPRPPSWSWLLTALPIAMAFVSTVITPVFQREHGVHLGSNDTTGFALLSIAIGVLLAISSRRVMRLVPGNELPLVILASSLWVLGAMVGETRGDDLWAIRSSAQNEGALAAWAAPHLWATAIVLAGASLMRASPGRRVSFGLFGFAVTIPFLSLVVSLDTAVQMGGLFMATLATGFALAVATIAASGDAGRQHAPLSIASAVCATLALAAWTTTVTDGVWRGALGISETEPAARMQDALAPVLTFQRLWVWMLLPMPLVSLVGLVFRGRATKAAVASSAALLFLAALPTVTVSLGARAEYPPHRAGVRSATRLRGRGPIPRPGLRARGRPRRRGLRPSRSGPRPGRRARSAPALERARARELRSMGTPSSRGRWGSAPRPRGGPRPRAHRGRARRERRRPRQRVPRGVVPGRRRPSDRSGARDPLGHSGPGADLLRGSSRAVRPPVHHRSPGSGRGGRLGGHAPHGAGGRERIAPFEALREVLDERRRLEPNRRDLTVITDGGPSAQAVATALSAAYQVGFDALMLDDHYL
ncbi:MAG: hypothetical protein R3B82_20695 [Sandaracinaceae bacterium]